MKKISLFLFLTPLILAGCVGGNITKDSHEDMSVITDEKLKDISGAVDVEVLNVDDLVVFENEQYGFKIKYPRGWELNNIKSFSPIGGAPIICESRPDECKTDFYNFTQNNEYYSIRVAGKDFPQLPSESTTSEWTEGHLTRCIVQKKVIGSEFNFLLITMHTPKRVEEYAGMQVMCESGRYEKEFDEFFKFFDVE